MFNFRRVRKFDFFLSLVISLGFMCSTITGYIGINFPRENELSYTTGIYSIVEQPEYVNHIMLNQINENYDSQLFTCSYNSFGNGSSSSCGDKKYLTPYVGNVVTIGWYEQKKFLGFENDVAQMVTIETNGKIIRSYRETFDYIKSMNNFSLYMDIPFSVLSFPLFYWLFGWLSRPRGKNKIES